MVSYTLLGTGIYFFPFLVFFSFFFYFFDFWVFLYTITLYNDKHTETLRQSNRKTISVIIVPIVFTVSRRRSTTIFACNSQIIGPPWIDNSIVPLSSEFLLTNNNLTIKTLMVVSLYVSVIFRFV